MAAEPELSGVVTDDDGVGEQPMGLDAAPEGAFGGDQHRVWHHLERRDAEPVEMGQPRRPVGEALVGMLGEQPDDRPGERAAAHIGERFGVDHIIPVTGAQQLEEVEPALGAGRPEPGEAVVADVGAEAVLRLVAGAGIVDRDPGGRGEAGAQHFLCFVEEAVLALDQ